MVFRGITVYAFPFKAVPNTEPQHWGTFFLLLTKANLCSLHSVLALKKPINQGLINDGKKLSRK